MSNILGRESAIVRGMRPAYEKLLNSLGRGKGLPWSINGEQCQIDAHYRSSFPSVYEPELAEILRRCVQPNSVCLDVGANTGIYVLQLASWTWPEGKIIAFEANIEASHVLQRHIHLNGLDHRVQIAPFAVGAPPSKSFLYSAEHSGMSRLGSPNQIIAQDAHFAEVEVVTVDQYCSEHGISPDILLMDIEGFEIAALAGAARTIAGRGEKLSIFIEMHPAVWDSAGTTPEEAKQLFRNLGRQVVPLTGQIDPFIEYGHVELVHLL